MGDREREGSWEEESAQPLRFITVYTSGHLRGTIISKNEGFNHIHEGPHSGHHLL